MRGKRKKGKKDREGAEWGGICLAKSVVLANGTGKVKKKIKKIDK